MRLLVPLPVAAAAVPIALLLAACTSGNTGGGVVTVTVPPSTPRAASSPAGNLSGSNTATPGAPSASSTATKLPGNCADVLSDYYVQQALGSTALGTDQFVVGVPDKTVGRLSTINCRYGVSGTSAKVEIGVSLYSTAAQATTRINATTTDYTAHGATAKSSTVTPQGQSGYPGTYLSGGSGSGYTLPLLVVAADRRTVAVTIDPATLKTPPAEQAATAVAKVALQRTAV